MKKHRGESSVQIMYHFKHGRLQVLLIHHIHFLSPVDIFDRGEHIKMISEFAG